MILPRKLALGAALLAMASSVAVYPWLPERVPVHFDLSGAPNGWASRPVGAFLTPVVMLGIIMLGASIRRASGAIHVTTALASGLLLTLHVLVLRAALAGGGLGDLAWLAFGVFLAALGLVLPRVPRNRWVGVRTPWSMSSPEAWARSQRAGGYAFFFGGLLLALSSAWTGPFAYALRLAALLGAAAVSVVASYAAHKS